MTTKNGRASLPIIVILGIFCYSAMLIGFWHLTSRAKLAGCIVSMLIGLIYFYFRKEIARLKTEYNQNNPAPFGDKSTSYEDALRWTIIGAGLFIFFGVSLLVQLMF